MTILVTGGGGFLGGAIIRKLIQQGHEVRSFTRSRYAWLDDIGVSQVHGDLADLSAVQAAVRGCDLVMHTAAKAGIWGKPEEFYQTNVVGTQNILAACQAEKITKLVYTSTPSVVHTGEDLENGNESLPYPEHFEADYPRTKAEAEQAVLAANGEHLATVALRPHLIWGPGDPHLVPRILARARAGKLRRIGTRDVKVDVTYIDNAADAHLLAAERIAPGSAIAGKAYFISNGEPIFLWEFLNQVLRDAGVPPVTRSVSPRLAKTLGSLLERFYRWFGLSGEPPMTRFVASQLSTSHWYDISAARRDLGYEPHVSIAQGLARLAQSYQQEQR